MKAIIVALAISTIICFASAACNSTVSAAGCANCADSVTIASGISSLIPSSLTPTLQGICTTCNSGFFYTPATTCVACSANCLVCANATTCLSCNSTGYYLVAGVCQSCSATTAANNVTGVAGCLTCSAPTTLPGTVSCSACNPAIGYQSAPANSSACTLCTASTFPVSGCIGCQNSTVAASKLLCSICPSGTAVPSGTLTAATASCATFTSVANCFLQSATANQCTTCNEGYYLATATSCLACPAGCKTCTTATACTACLPGYGLPGTPAGTNVDQCVSCSAGGTSNSLTYTGVAGCTACSFTQGTAGPVACTMCNTTLAPASNVCASNTTNCATGCATCSSAGNSSACTSCMTGYMLFNNGSCVVGTGTSGCLVSQNTFANSSTQCIACAAGYLSTVPTCTACGSNCATCTSATACTACNANTSTTNFTLTNGACANSSSNGTGKSSNILLPGMALLSMIFYYLF